MNLTLYLMRHGRAVKETPWRFLGQREVPLSKEGQAQAAWWRGELAGVDFASAWSSDLGRCRETAAVVLEGRGVAASPQPGLREISLGEWDGLTVEEVRGRFPGQYEARGADLAGFTPSGGESFRDMSSRACAALDSILASHPGSSPANLLIVAHAGVNRTILCRLLGIPLERLFSLDQEPGCLNIVSLGDGGPRLRSLNAQPPV